MGLSSGRNARTCPDGRVRLGEKQLSITPTSEELSKAKDWFESTFKSTERFPVSFKLDGKESASLLGNWGFKWSSSNLQTSPAHHVVVLSDPDSGLELRCEVKQFNDFPAIEWVGYLKNNADKPSAIVSDISALDSIFGNSNAEHSTLHYAKGSDHKIDDFEPMNFLLRKLFNENVEIGSVTGRSSEGAKGGALPFFNLQLGNEGVIGAVGWTGSWKASFSREGYDSGEVSVKAGMRRTHLSLLPGEEIRTPSMVLLFWDGDRVRSQNMFRRLVLAHFTPAVNGVPAKVPTCQCVWGENMAHRHIGKARWYRDCGIDIDAYWIDAGWYGDAPFKEDSDVFTSEWAKQVGNWWPNKTTYPNGMKPIGDALKQMDLGFVLWFEPERVYKDTWLVREHPEWLLGPFNIDEGYLLNLGIPEAREYITDMISAAITEGGVTCYRQDFNMVPAPFWEAADAPDRAGMSEIRHIEGLYAFWDELLSRHPGLLIDNCASGGRRIDIETTRRSIPLWRSDYQCFAGFNLTGVQNQTHGLAPWVPLSSGSCDTIDQYAFRSAFGPGRVTTANVDEREPVPDSLVERFRKLTDEQREVSQYFYGDFYPLLEYSLNDDVWSLWQYDRPDLGEGLILAFRRHLSPFVGLDAKLQALDRDAVYEIRSFDGDEIRRASGSELLEYGLPISIKEMPGSAVFVYRRVS